MRPVLELIFTYLPVTGFWACTRSLTAPFREDCPVFVAMGLHHCLRVSPGKWHATASSATAQKCCLRTHSGLPFISVYRLFELCFQRGSSSSYLGFSAYLASSQPRTLLKRKPTLRRGLPLAFKFELGCLVWRAFRAALFGQPIGDGDRNLFRRCAGLDAPPSDGLTTHPSRSPSSQCSLLFTFIPGGLNSSRHLVSGTASCNIARVTLAGRAGSARPAHAPGHQ